MPGDLTTAIREPSVASDEEYGRRGAISQEDCETCPDPVRSQLGGEIVRGTIAATCPYRWEHLAVQQGEEIRRQGEAIRGLIRERNAEQAKGEAAYDLAEHYAREAGHDIARDDVLCYVEQYWSQRAGWDAHMTELETLHWDIFGIAGELQGGLTRHLTDGVTAAELAVRLMERIRAINPYDGRKKGKELFLRPVAPTGAEPTLFEEAS